MSSHATAPGWPRVLEELRPIPGFPHHAVSVGGVVRDLRSGPVRTHRGAKFYLAVSLTDDLGGQARILVHHIVAWVFHGPRPWPRAHARHLDGNPLNNASGNLRWGTAKENGEDRVRHGTAVRGEAHRGFRFRDEDVTEMKRRVGAGERPKDVAAAFGTTDRLVYGLVNGTKRREHVCAYDAAALSSVRKPVGAEELADIRRLRVQGLSLREIGRRLGRSHPAVSAALARQTPPAALNPAGVGSRVGFAGDQAAPAPLVYPSGDGDRNWRPIPGRAYLIAPDGVVWDLARGEFVRPREELSGYRLVVLRGQMGEPVSYRLHGLVARVFHGPPPAGGRWMVRHKDNNPANNRAENLEWGQEADNAADRIRAGATTRGERSASSKLTEAEVAAIRQVRARGEATLAELAGRFGVALATVSLAASGKTWRHSVALGPEHRPESGATGLRGQLTLPFDASGSRGRG